MGPDTGIEVLRDPEHDGVIKYTGVMRGVDLKNLQDEINDPEKVVWRDVHDEYENARGLTITQNHFAYALRLGGRGKQGPVMRMPLSLRQAGSMMKRIRAMEYEFPSLAEWTPTEMLFHKYDSEVGLSFHKDHPRFIGMIAILAVEGECDLVINNERTDEITSYSTSPGDLILVRAPELYETDEDICPEHAVMNLRTPTRTSLMFRHDSDPDNVLRGYKFDN